MRCIQINNFKKPYMDKPIRIQRSRQHKQVSPNELPIVYVGRPGKWGNPYKVGKTIKQCDYLANPDYDEKDFLSFRGVNFRQPYVNSYMRRVEYNDETIVTPKIGVELYEHYLSNLLVADDTGHYVNGEYNEPENLGTLNKELEKLKGKNLSCWCKVGDPCHADILLDLINS